MTTQIEARRLSGIDQGKTLESSIGPWEIRTVEHDRDGIVIVRVDQKDDLGIRFIELRLFPDTVVTITEKTP